MIDNALNQLSQTRFRFLLPRPDRFPLLVQRLTITVWRPSADHGDMQQECVQTLLKIRNTESGAGKSFGLIPQHI